MSKRIISAAALALTVTAAALAITAPAGASTEARVQLVSGSALYGQLSGSLEGQVLDTPDTFATFLATYRLSPGGVFTWRAPQVFQGCIAGRCGKLYLEGHFLYRFRPGTKVYDFGGPPEQPGTTGDPASWLSGGSVTRITGGEGEFEGASGILLVKETAFLTSHVYAGVVRV